MFLKGIMYSLYKNKVVKFYPKTLAEQVLIDKNSTKTLLDRLINIDAGEAITNPDEALSSGQTYTISKSDKMPTQDDYALVTIKYDDTSMYQEAISIKTQEKIERWYSDGAWSDWTGVSTSGLTLSSVSVQCDIESDNIHSFKNPIVSYDEAIQHISALVVNTSYLTQDKFTVTSGSITLHDTEKSVDTSDEVYVILHQLIKNDKMVVYNFDGSRIAPKTITSDKIADEAFMTTDDVSNGTGNNKIVGKNALDKKGEIILNAVSVLISDFAKVGKIENIDDPDEAINIGPAYLISNSSKMPDLGEYVITVTKTNDTNMYQQAISIEKEAKIERWYYGTNWSTWSGISNNGLSFSSVSIKCDIESDDTHTFKNPIIGFDETTQHISALVINTSYITQDKFTVTLGNIKLHDTERSIDTSDSVYVILQQLVKDTGVMVYNFNGNNIAPGTITPDKFANAVFMTTDDVSNGTGNNKFVGKDALDRKGELIIKDISDITDEIYPNTALIEIKHDKNSYPNVKVIKNEYALGVAGIGEGPIGGSEGYSVPTKICYLDKNNIRLLVPKNYVLLGATLHATETDHYVVSFTDSVMTIDIDII